MTTEWEAKRLGDACLVDRNQGAHRGLPYVGLEQIEAHTGRFLGSGDPEDVKSSTFRFSPEHVLYGRLRPYLNKVLAPDFSGHCSTEIFPLKPRPGVLREFLCYWLRRDATVALAEATCRGARMPRANVDELLEAEFLVPPLSEQRRIVAILDEAFEGIATARANAEKNLDGSREVFESQREEALAARPGWDERPFADLCAIKHGFAFKSEFFTDAGDHVLLTPGNFFERGGYRDRGEKQKFYDGPIPAGFVLAEGDMLVAMTEQAAGLLGSPIIVPEAGKFLHNQRLGLVVPHDVTSWSTDFFFHVFNLKRVRREIHAGGTGQKVRHTSPSKIGAVRVAFPRARSEQANVARRLTLLEEESQRLEGIYQQKLDVLDELKRSVLHHAFSGAL